MKKFSKLDKYSNDDLIIIVYHEAELWQKEAVVYAQQLLLSKGVTEEYAKKRIIEIKEEVGILWKNELEERKTESFATIDLALMSLFWFNYILSDWYLAREGYLKMRKQRLIAIGIGFSVFAVFMLSIAFSLDEFEQERIDEINQIGIKDSVAISKIDWSGTYVFIDANTDSDENVVWKLILQKKEAEHIGNLTISNNKSSTEISCIGLIKKELIEFFPDTIYVLFDGLTISYYDRLFTFTKQNNKVYTQWDKMTPFNKTTQNNTGLFIKTTQ